MNKQQGGLPNTFADVPCDPAGAEHHFYTSTLKMNEICKSFFVFFLSNTQAMLLDRHKKNVLL